MSAFVGDFRVSVSLEQYFNDERKRCYILVNGNKRVEWLKDRLKSTFKLEESFCLISRGHLLLSDEQLCILQPDEPVEVIPLKRECTTDKEDLVQNCRFENGDVNRSKRKRKLHGENVHNEMDKLNNSVSSRNPVQEISHSDHGFQEDKLPKVESLQDVKCRALAILDEYSHTTETPESEPPLRRRVRHRTRKRRRRPAASIPSPSTDQTPNASCIALPTPSFSTVPYPTSTIDDTTLVLHNASLEPRIARIVHPQ